MQTITFQRFSIVQSVSLIWIFCDKLKYTLKLSFVIIYSLLFSVYLSKKMAELLEQMNFDIKKLYYEINDSSDSSKKNKGQYINQAKRMSNKSELTDNGSNL